VGFIEKLDKLPSQYLWVILLCVSSIAILRPIGLPVVPSSLTRDGYNFIEDLPPDSVVVLDWSATSGYGPELETQCVAVFRHLLSRPLKVIIVSFASEGPLLYDMALEGSKLSGVAVKPEEDYGKIYGEDYVFLGYIPGNEVAFVAFAEDSWMTEKDEYGKPLEELPIMQYCKTVEDWSLAVTLRGSFFEEMIGLWNSAYGLPIIMGGPGVSCPRLFPFYAAGQLVSIIVSVVGSSHYETLIGEPGLGCQLMDGLSLAQLLIVASIIVGNIAGYYKRRGGK